MEGKGRVDDRVVWLCRCKSEFMVTGFLSGPLTCCPVCKSVEIIGVLKDEYDRNWREVAEEAELNEAGVA